MTRDAVDDSSLLDQIDELIQDIRSKLETIEATSDDQDDTPAEYALGKILGISRNALVSVEFAGEHLELLKLRLEDRHEP